MNRAVRLLAMLPFLLTACDATSDVPLLTEAAAPAVKPGPDAPVGELLNAVRGATARFNATTQAIAAGYAASHECVPAMGFHWVNGALVDPEFDPLRPEVLLYAPDANGRLKLVAVEYIVIDVGQGRPAFAGHALDVGGTPVPAPHWSLHVWLYEANPDGLLTAFNPAVACS